MRGEANEFYDSLVKDIEETFGIQPLNSPPHITLKIPFETDDISSVVEILEEFAKEQASVPLTVDGFGQFNNNVIFMSVDKTSKIDNIVQNFDSSLKKLSWMKFGEYEIDREFHITITKNIKDRFEKVWSFVSKKSPHFDLYFDSVALMQYDGEKWNIYAEFPFKK